MTEHEAPTLPTEEHHKAAAETATKVVEASEPMKLEPPDPGAKGPWIVYTGPGTVRVIKESDWAAMGLEGKRCEWNYLNKRRLPKSQFSHKQLDYLLNVDGRFSESDTTE